MVQKQVEVGTRVTHQLPALARILFTPLPATTHQFGMLLVVGINQRKASWAMA
jgi:hypothetical protein